MRDREVRHARPTHGVSARGFSHEKLEVRLLCDLWVAHADRTIQAVVQPGHPVTGLRKPQSAKELVAILVRKEPPGDIWETRVRELPQHALHGRRGAFFRRHLQIVVRWLLLRTEATQPVDALGQVQLPADFLGAVVALRVHRHRIVRQLLVEYDGVEPGHQVVAGLDVLRSYEREPLQLVLRNVVEAEPGPGLLYHHRVVPGLIHDARREPERVAR